ncbi:MAG: bifunctional (p)ppGpp synthetase/guanosine-3',5'-bis(diphosphate) 3'-pyrophosphohydrolase [Candidatus Vogelbacteria bacterium]|nr:bifunctional (p)ppGpp synthetase/guanosine-3',5'-bis(diphosphate) 3'-pyrophosphohydrolase [Candidatus Vogelbacteria bacterium]
MSGFLDKVKAIVEVKWNREAFFKVVSEIYPSLDPRHKLLRRAYEDTKRGFQGIFREGGDRYFEHPRFVVLILIIYLRVKDLSVILAGMLHDNSEDLPSYPIERVRENFGERVAELVQRLTKRPRSEFSSKEEQEKAYHALFATADRDFFLIKLADRLHNLLTLGACSEEKMRRKVEETRLYYMPYAEKYWILYHELDEAMREIEKKYLPAGSSIPDSKYSTY